MDQPPPVPAMEPAGAPPGESSLASRLLNVIATPGEVFDQVKVSPPKTTNWLVPALLLIVVSWVGSAVVFSQPAIRQQLNEITDKTFAKSKMPEAQLEQARQVTQIIQKASIVAAPVMRGLVTIWIWALVLWLGGAKLWKGNFEYMKAVEVVGLSNMIAVLDAVLRTLLIMVTGNLFSGAGPALLIKDIDLTNPTHTLALQVDLMGLWSLSLRALGLARLARVGFARAAIWVFGIWITYTGVIWGLGELGKMASRH